MNALIRPFAILIASVTWLSGNPVFAQTVVDTYYEAPTGSLDVGKQAVDFDLPQYGSDDTLKLSDQYADGPVVVVVLRGYPGYQCPLCSRQVGALANRASALAKAASRVILVYPGEANELTEHAEEFMGARMLPKPIVLVRDPDMKMVSDWGLRWKAPKETAYPATYVINSEGKVVWRKVSQSHAGRSTVEEVLKAIKKAGNR